MESIKVHDKWFKPYLSEAQILERVKAVAERMNEELKGKNPLFLPVLNGAYIFAADLTRFITIPMEVSFVKLASYQGFMSTGKVREVMGINEDLEGRTVVIVEDIIDTGRSMKQMIETLGTRNPAEIKVCTLLLKPGKLEEDLQIDYCAMEIPNDFILGYGLDYDQQGRQLRSIYVVDNEAND
ncbi:MAG: hypoxanthine phosphoribosyltransferase [Bacteroidaceae bacterium]|mgnify:FL=1|nr:hypoxanthine phosphoribosyltransferase [Bacteroidaceae bacterium]